MRAFAEMFDAIDRTTSTLGKVGAIEAYLRSAEPADAAWAVHFLAGRRLKRLVSSRTMWAWLRAAAPLPEWLIAECFDAVGDSAETIALVIEGAREHGSHAEARGEARDDDASLREWIEDRLQQLPTLDPGEQQRRVLMWWARLEGTRLLVLNKLLTGALRLGVSQRLVVRAVARVAGLDEATIEHRLSGDWRPTAEWYGRLIAPRIGPTERVDGPYPFFLASPIVDPLEAPGMETDPERLLGEKLGQRAEWIAEWKWDGIRSQLIRRDDTVRIWSRGDELMTERFPEVALAATRLPSGVAIDGELLAWRQRPLPFALLQKRIGRTALTPAVLREAPAAMVAYDLLEHEGQDIRALPLRERRARLASLLGSLPGRAIVLSAEIESPTWAGLAGMRARSRLERVEGLMLKRASSAYGVGRVRGDWWKWKIEPYSIDAVLVYAQPGHGRRAGLLTDYTFAVWDEGHEPDSLFGSANAVRRLVPIAKAYSGLDAGEIDRLDRWIRSNSAQRFGPVRSVEPVQVFELHFEGLRTSNRHASGVALRFPRIARWRRDKAPEQADTLRRVMELLHGAT